MPEDPGAGARAEHSGAEAEVSEPIAMSFRDALDQSVEPEASEVIAHATLRKVLIDAIEVSG